MASFPTSLPDYPAVVGSQVLGAAGLLGTARLLNDLGEDMDAVAAKLGYGASIPSAGTILRGTGAGQSAYGKIIINTDLDTFSSADLRGLLTDETGTGVAVFATTPTLITPKVDTINENTSANGVTIDGLNIKDNKLNTNDSVVETNITNSAVTANKIATDAVTTAKIQNSAVTAAKIVGIDKSLLTTDSNPYKFKVRRNSAFNFSNGSFGKITFDTELYDTNNNFASGTYTAPVSGFYQFNWRASTSSGSGTPRVLTALYVNGNPVARGSDVSAPFAGSSGSDIVQLAATDTVEVLALTTTAGLAADVSGADTVYFSGFLVCRT